MPENRTASLEERLIALEGGILALHYVILNIIGTGSVEQTSQIARRLGNLSPRLWPESESDPANAVARKMVGTIAESAAKILNERTRDR